MNTEFKRGVRESLPIVFGVLPFGLILGAQAAQKGMSSLETMLMMGLNFAGGSEFATVGAWTSPIPVLLIWTLTLMINSRHILMGAAFAPYLRDLPLRQLLPTLFVMIDETWAMGMAEIKKREQLGLPAFNLPYYWGIAVVLYMIWLLCGLVGSQFGYLLGNDIEKFGFGMAFPAVFLVLVRGMWRGMKAARPWVVSLVVAALVYLMLPNGGWYVLVGTLSGLVMAYFTENE
ncbi:AzlC family ABC transporter permease [Simonsiella muelleri]|uniref:AzlC family ABC transporter permease n=1 Tax=Simonsiella muelleri TaxID=72 RepID=UPI0028D23B2F|nr:AzlC family ABC transporter permease [Simonsiella muelleri]